jgi:CRISPR-associated endoribonuclease Cas6
MKIELSLETYRNEHFVVPKVNLHLFQGFIYNLFSEKRSAFLHDHGYEFEGRRFKLFVFSWPRAKKIRIEEDRIVFQNPVSIVLASPVSEILQDLVNGALLNQTLRIGNNEIQCTRIHVLPEPDLTENIKVKALSPITSYSTMYRKDGSPYTVYHSPAETEFKNQIHENLVKKYRLVNRNVSIPEGKISIEPIGTPRQQIALFKKEDPRPIKGWWGIFRIKGPVELIRVGLDAGFGAKNSGGWGCVEMLCGRGGY